MRLAVDVQLLGPLQVLDGNRAVSVSGDTQRGLLALLALKTPHVVPADAISDTLWPNGASDNVLHVTISRVRKALGNEAIETTPGGYRMALPVSNIDVERFRRNVLRGRQLLTLGQPVKSAEALRHALAQWRGDPLQDIRQFDFAEKEARVLEEERMKAVEMLMEAELAIGDHELVVCELSGLVEAFPFRERLWSQLMLALYRSGRQAEALRSFGRIRALLADELGIEPSLELSNLEERILLHDPALDDLATYAATPGIEGVEPELVGFSPGEVIVKEGATADAVYWIESGKVEVSRCDSEGETVLAELGQGRYFGELASLLRTGRTASVRAVMPTTVSVHSVESFRLRLGAERARELTDSTPAESVSNLLRGGQYLQAYDLATELIHRGNTDPEIRYTAVLSLAKSGATTHARRRYEGLGLGSVTPTEVSPRLAEDIAALSPRLDKDMALARPPSDRGTWARRSAEGYRAAFVRHRSRYLAVNAATMWLVAGHRLQAEQMARAALGIVPSSKLGTDDQYWEYASEAEAALTLGDVARAETAIATAGRLSPDNHAARATTLRQLRMVCELLGQDASILTPLANPSIIHYCGHRIAPMGASGRFRSDEEGRVRSELESTFGRLGVGFGVGSLAAGADILAAEALLERGAELNVVLPFNRDEFVRVSVAPAGDAWIRRFERCLAAASDVVIATASEYLDDPILFDFCSRIAMGDALMRARHLETEVHQVAVWDGHATGDAAGTAVDVARWQGTGYPSTVIQVSSEARVTRTTEVPRRRIRALIFADFAGFSALSDGQVAVFQEQVMSRLAATVEHAQPHLLSGRTWGDGMYLVLDDVAAAADCALTLQEAVLAMDFPSHGLPGLRGLRVAAHATPVFEGWDPIGGNRLFYGAGVTQTARIEPRTPEGEVYATHPFAALALLERDRTFDCQYVGVLPTAKGFGTLPLFALRRRIS